uniref:CPXV002 protein n=1 Tax=Cowpox virus TaxID=10243 RepID=A0A0K2YYG2_COWPX|nr:CPXV002 protein [Cowpox virus]
MSRVNRTIQAHHKLKKVYRTLYSGLQNKNVPTFTKSYLSRLLLFLSQYVIRYDHYSYFISGYH